MEHAVQYKTALAPEPFTITIAGRGVMQDDTGGRARLPKSWHDGSDEGKDTSTKFVSLFTGFTMVVIISPLGSGRMLPLHQPG